MEAKLSSDARKRAEDFIWRNARLLERRLYAFHYLEGSRGDVLSALAGYQNADGGFGNALEPDKRCPDSQPVDAEVACLVMRQVGFEPGMSRRLLDYLTTITTPEGGVPFCLPTVRPYPRAPWWDAEPNPPASINPTASLVGLLRQAGIDHPWLTRAEAYCWDVIENGESAEVHELSCILTFLEHAADHSRAERAFKGVADRILSTEGAVLDPESQAYGKKPLDWAPRPDSLCRPLFSDALIERSLSCLAAEQQGDGGWAISWEPISEAVRLEWRGMITLQALRTLDAYGRLES